VGWASAAECHPTSAASGSASVRLSIVAQLPADIEEKLRSSSWWANVLGGLLVALGAAGVGAYLIAAAKSRETVIAGILLLFAGLLIVSWLTYWLAPVLWRKARGRPADPNT